MASMTKEEALRYIEGYAAVNRITIEEQRRATIADRFRGLESLFLSGLALDWFEKMNEEEERARQLWVRLKERLESNNHNGKEAI